MNKNIIFPTIKSNKNISTNKVSLYALVISLIIGIFPLFLLTPEDGWGSSKTGNYAFFIIIGWVILFIINLIIFQIFSVKKDVNVDRKKLTLKRLHFYSLLLGGSALIGYIPIWLFEPSGGWGMGGFIFSYYWAILLLIDIVFYLIHEFRNLPSQVNFQTQRTISIVYTSLAAVFLLYEIIYIVLIYTKFESFNTLNQLYFYILSNVLPILIILLVCLWHYLLARKSKPLARKIFVISTLLLIIYIPYAMPYINDGIRGYKNMAKQKTFNTAIAQNDLSQCSTVNSESVCKREIAIKNNNTTLCLELTDGSDSRYSERYKCLMEILKKTRDEQICNLVDEYIKDKRAGEWCRSGALSYQQMALTAGLSDEEITNKALAENNFNLCYGISHGEHQADCQLAVAKINNMTFCEKIRKFNGEKQIHSCYEFYGHKITGVHLYDYDDIDNDKLYDYIEIQVWKTNPEDADTDDDGYLDGEEVKNGYDPLVPNLNGKDKIK